MEYCLIDKVGFDNLDLNKKHMVKKRDTISLIDKDTYNSDLRDLEKLVKFTYKETVKLGNLDEATELICDLGDISNNTFVNNIFTNNLLSQNIYSLDVNNNALEVVTETKVGEQQAFYTKRYGYFEAINTNEGGTLYNYTKHGEEVVSHGNYIAVHQIFDKVYAFRTVEYSNKREFAIEQIVRHKDKYITTTLVSSIQYDLDCFYISGYNIYFIVNKMLYRLNTETDEITFIDNVTNAKTLTIYNDKAFIGNSNQLIEMDLNTKDKRYFTFLSENTIKNSWYVHNIKLKDIWNKLVKDMGD